MKKLSRLGINPNRIIKKKDLITLKGGYDCDMGQTLYYCEVFAVQGGSSQYGAACVPQGIVHIGLWVERELDVYKAFCSIEPFQ